MQNEKTELNALYHYGIKGQKWGIRRFEDISENQVKSEKNRLDAQVESEKNKLAYKQSIYLGKQEVKMALNRNKTDQIISRQQEISKRKKYATIGAIAIAGFLSANSIASTLSNGGIRKTIHNGDVIKNDNRSNYNNGNVTNDFSNMQQTIGKGNKEEFNSLKNKVDVPKPKVDVPKSKVDVPKPKVDVPKPKVDVPKPKVDVPKPKVDVPKPKVDVSKPNVDAPKFVAGLPKPNLVEAKRFNLKDIGYDDYSEEDKIKILKIHQKQDKTTYGSEEWKRLVKKLKYVTENARINAIERYRNLSQSSIHLSNNENVLMHYGTKGMRWGIRKAYDEDPTISSKTRKYELDLEKTKAEQQTIRETNLLRYKEAINTGKQRLFQSMNNNAADIKITKIQEDTKRNRTKTIGALAIIGILVGSSIAKKSIKASSKMKHSDNYSDELLHYGIKGQKWGDRRYQNEDGSLTPEGRIRYAKTIEEVANKNKTYNKAMTEIKKDFRKYRIEKLKKDYGIEKDEYSDDDKYKNLSDEEKKVFQKEMKKIFDDTEHKNNLVTHDIIEQAIAEQESINDLERTKILASGARSVSKSIHDAIPNTKGIYSYGDYSSLDNKYMEDVIRRKDIERRYAEAIGDVKYKKSGAEQVKEIFEIIDAPLAVIGSVASTALLLKKLNSGNGKKD